MLNDTLDKGFMRIRACQEDLMRIFQQDIYCTSHMSFLQLSTRIKPSEGITWRLENFQNQALWCYINLCVYMHPVRYSNTRGNTTTGDKDSSYISSCTVKCFDRLC